MKTITQINDLMYIGLVFFIQNNIVLYKTINIATLRYFVSVRKFETLFNYSLYTYHLYNECNKSKWDPSKNT